MPRKPFVQNPIYPYHVSARSNGRDWFALPTDKVWEIMSRYLFFLHHAFGVRIHSFVLMDNHWHLIATFPHGNFSEAMNYFMRETSRCIGFESNRINHVYGARCFRSALTNERYFMHAYKYVYRNPVEAKLAEAVEEYRYSTLASLLGQSYGIIPVEEDTLLFGDEIQNLRWLNRAPEFENYLAVKRALRHPEFHLAKDRHNHKDHDLERELY